MTNVQFVVGAVIVNSLAEPRRVLASRRTRPAALKGRWEFPGGKVEPGESVEAALIREVREELDVTIVLGEELAPSVGGWPICERLTLRIFWAEIFLGAPTPSGSHDQIAWLAATELDSVDWLDADFAALPAMRAELTS